MIDIVVTDELLVDLAARHIRLGWPNNPHAPWLKAGQTIRLNQPVSIESNTGLYRANYQAQLGGENTCGLCSIGFLSYAHSPLPDRLLVGRYCSISDGLRFLDSLHPAHLLSTSVFTYRRNHILTEGVPNRENFLPPSLPATAGKAYPVIGHDVWIGSNVTLSLGIKIGTGAVLAANAVVTKDVPPYAVVAGNPGRIKKYRFSESQIAGLLGSCWWDYCYTDFDVSTLSDIDRFLDDLELKKARGLAPFNPGSVQIGGPVKVAQALLEAERLPSENRGCPSRRLVASNAGERF